MVRKIAVDNISVSFNGTKAIKNVSFEIQEGEVVAIIGPNGSGKTTILNVLSGFITPDHGSVRLADTDITNLAVFHRARLGIARTFQKSRVFGGLNVASNFALLEQSNASDYWKCLLPWLGSYGAEVSCCFPISEVLHKFDLDGIESKLAGSLSFGQKKLIEIFRTRYAEAGFLLLDEPVAGLSPINQQRVLQTIGELRRKDVGILLVEHNLQLVSNIANRVILLDKGQVIKVGGPEIINDKSLRNVFGRIITEVRASGLKKDVSPGNDEDEIISLNGVSVNYNSEQALSGIDLRICRGESVCIFGQNGSGKSTLLKSIAGTLQNGQIRGSTKFEGEDISGLPAHKRYVKGICYQPQSKVIFDELTTEENLRLLNDIPTAKNHRDVWGSIVPKYFPDLLNYRKSKAGALSGGMKQIVGIIRAVLSGAKLLLLDEPLAGVFSKDKVRILQYLRDLSDSSAATILMVEQDIATAFSFASRVIILRNGEKVLDQGSAKVAQDSIFQLMFGTSLGSSTAQSKHCRMGR